jgi:hypothetical protein
MKCPSVILFTLGCFLAVPLIAQPQIGGGTCSSATLSGPYAVSLTGRQVNTSGNFTNVFQANGSATFDGLSQVTLSLTSYTLASLGTSTVASAGTALPWSGTYSMQSNCSGQITITTGGSATLNIVSYDNGADFLLTGSDATYSYAGSGNTQPGGCSASSLSGLYSFNGTGFEFSSGAVAGAGDVVGILQFDGQGNLTVNVLVAGEGNSASSGPYSVSSDCVGSATLAASNGRDTFAMNFSVYNISLANSGFFATIAFTFGSAGGVTEGVLVTGGGHVISGQSTTGAANREAGGSPPSNLFAKLWSAAALRSAR